MDLRMLINAIHTEETRIAIIDGQELTELEIESNVGKKLKGNIYKARVSRLEPSLQAAFLDIGTQRNGFLQINDIHPAYFNKKIAPRTPLNRISISDVLSPGQELVVQIVKEERDLKGATLTTYLSLPGRYVVLMPGSDRGGISRKISDPEQRVRLKKLAHELELPVGLGLIVRTAGLDRSLSELSRDLTLQLKLWEQILNDSQNAPCPTVLYEESNVTTRVIRDYFTPEIREIIIDNPVTFQGVKLFVEQVMPRYRSRVRLYQEKQPLFSHYGVSEQVAATFESEVKLASGGAIVIDTLEALVAIDVNSGKATAGGGIEDTAYRTNLEAADEIARQLRLRDLGGLIVVDFIDMVDRRHKQDVENRIAASVQNDKARIEVGKLSRFGLLEMSRQRLRASLSSQSSVTCAHCRGTGKIRSHELVALEALRKIQSAIIVGHVQTVKARMSPGVALFLLNQKKVELVQLEKDYDVRILILADGRIRQDEVQFEMAGQSGGNSGANPGTIGNSSSPAHAPAAVTNVSKSTGQAAKPTNQRSRPRVAPRSRPRSRPHQDREASTGSTRTRTAVPMQGKD